MVVGDRLDTVALAQNLVAIKGIDCAVLAVADAVCAVGKGVAAKACQPAHLRPGQGVAQIGGGVAHGVIDAGQAVIAVQPVTPAFTLVSIGLGIQASTEIYVGAEGIFLFEQNVAADVVIPNVSLTGGVVILTLKTVQSVVIILGQQGRAPADCFQIAIVLYHINL